MSNGFNLLIEKLSAGSVEARIQQRQGRIHAVKSYLNGLDEIRVFIADHPDFEYIANGVQILRRLIRLVSNDDTQFTLVFSDNLDKEKLHKKLQLLIPQAQVNGKFTLEGKDVVPVQLTQGQPLSPGKIGFTGGGEGAMAAIAPPVELNVTNFIQLQPYASINGLNAIVTQDNENGKVHDLDAEFKDLFLQKRGYLLSEPAVDESENNDAEEIASFLMTQVSRIHLAAVGSLDQLDNLKAATALMNYAAGIIEAQDRLTNAKKPTVLVLVSEFSSLTTGQDTAFVKNITTQKAYFDLLASSPARPDDDFFTWPTALPRPNQNYLAWHQQHQVQERIRFEKNPTLQVVKNQVNQTLKNNEIYIIALGQVSASVLHQLYQKATLPTVCNTFPIAERLLNTGRPFLKLHDNSASAAWAYSSLPLHRNTAAPTAAQCLKASYQGLYAQHPGNWPRKTDPLFPPPLVLKFIQAYLEPDKNEWAAYFQELRDFFQDELNDKLLAGLDILVNNLQAPKQEEENLEELKEKLEELKEEDGKLDFKKFTEEYAIPLLKNDLIKTFLSKVIGADGFEIAGAKINYDASLPKVTLRGDSAAFGVGNMQLEIAFSVGEKNVIDTDFAATLNETQLSMPGAEWLSADTPKLTLQFRPGSPTPTAGEIATVLTSGTSVDILLRVPAAPNTLLLQGNFIKNRPEFTNLFQMIGGLNLASVLPEQLQLLADIEVRDFELHYDYQLHQMQTIGINLALPDGKEWGLVPAVKATGLHMSMLVKDASSLNRTLEGSVYGQYAIGDATGFVSAQMPRLFIAGGLEENSKPLTLQALIDAYVRDVQAPGSIGNTAITSLLFQADRANQLYSFGVAVNADWPVEIDGTTYFNIQNLGFFIKGRTSNIGASANGNAKKEISGLFNGNVQILPASEKAIDLSVTAAYETNAGWVFTAQQTTGAIAVSALLREYLHWNTDLDMQLDGLGLRIETQNSSFAFTARTAASWEIPFEPDEGGTLVGNVTFGSRVEKTSANKEERVYFGAVSADIRWRNIDLTVFYNFDPTVQQYGIRWWKLAGMLEIEGPANRPQKKRAVLRFTEATTLGEMIETMIGWATGSRFGLSAPWDLLNKVALDNLSLTYDFIQEKVSFNVGIGPIELGFARISSIGVTYNSDKANPANNGVLVDLQGTFFWQTENPQKPLSWDASRPETTPAPPGGGNKYLDLRLLALGQHVTLDCFSSADTIQKAIACMVNMPDPEPGKLPTIKFDPKSNWLIGADFGILALDQETSTDSGVKRVKQNYFLTLQIIFNDPHLYGLRLALEGKPAKVFAGLDFQVMYRRISDSVGVYQAEIQLPDVMRRMTIGAYTITLPVFGIAIYTNGDFQIDLGFPWNHDFTRSFGVEAIIPPGIPVVGAAGLYFGKLSSSTTNKVPAAVNGTFNPVIVFGFGAQIGVGKSFEAGLFRAGISLTIVGIIEGVLAKWNPYQVTSNQDGNTQVQGEYYFWLQGTFGIMGRLYGSVDFAVVRADVNVTLAVFAQITFATYEPIVFSVIARVDVKAKVRIKVAFIKITLHFSFSMRVKQTFTLENTGTPPWQVGRGSARSRGVLLSPMARRMVTTRSLTFAERDMVAKFESPRWDRMFNLKNRVKLEGFLTVAWTVAKDEYPDSEHHQVCGIVSLFMDATPFIENAEEQQTIDSSFDKLAKQVFRWLIAAAQSEKIKPADVDDLVVTREALNDIQAYLNNTKDNPEPIPSEAIDAFLIGQIELTIKEQSGGPEPSEEVAATYFPVPLHLRLTVPDYDDWKGISYNFGEYNAISESYLNELREHFDELAIHVEEPREDDEPIVFGRSVTNATTSLANYVRSDYFLLIARQMAEAAQRTLRNFKIEVPEQQSVDDILAWINENGQQEDGLFSRYDLFASNAGHPLNEQKKVRIGTYADYMVMPEESFDSIGKMDFDHDVTTLDIIIANAERKDILLPGRKVGLVSKGLYVTTGNESLMDIAKHFNISLAQLLKVTKLADRHVYLRPTIVLDIPIFIRYNLQEGDSFESIAAGTFQNSISAGELAQLNQYYPILKTGVQLNLPDDKTYEIAEGDTLDQIAGAHGLSLDELLTATVVGEAATVLAGKTIFNFRETLLIPPFDYLTEAADTLRSVAERFDISLEMLAETPENGTVIDLFNPDGFLNVPHLEQLKVGQILEGIQRTDGLKHLSGMASRYYLHGLRLPTQGVQPLHRGMWVREQGNALTLPAEAGLYALTGQQFAVPTLREDLPLAIKFELQPLSNTPATVRGGKWVRFESEESPLEWQLRLDLNDDGGVPWADAQRVQALENFAAEAYLDLQFLNLGMEKPYKTVPMSYSLASPASWNNASEIPLPYGNKPNGAAYLKLWRLPEALLHVPDRTKHAVDPVFKMMLGQYDQATGEMQEREIGYYGWSTAIEFSVKKVSETGSSDTAKTTYEIIGTGTREIVLLERLFRQPDREKTALYKQLMLAFDVEGDKQGIQTDIQRTTTMGIAKVNLSTDTRPPEQPEFLFRTRELDAAGKATLLNTELEFLQLLWEASITRSGGFYLYYFNSDTKEGLPDRLFNDKGEARVTLIVLYDKPNDEASQDRLSGFMNAVITGESLDASASSVYAQAQVRDEQLDRQPASGTTLAELGDIYFANIGDIALANARTPLRRGIQLTIEQGTFLVKPDGFAPERSFAAIAAFLGVSEKALRLTNNPLGRIHRDGILPAYTALRIPTITLAVDNDETTLAYLAEKYGVNLAGLAFSNRNVQGLFDEDLVIPSGPRVRSATIAVDQIALEAQCEIPEDGEALNFPDADVSANTFAKTLLRHNFQLMRFRLTDNLNFKGTGFGLPIGPATIIDADTGKEIWDYTAAVPYHRFLKLQPTEEEAAPEMEAQPYRGIDKILQAEFQWLDLYGNQIRTNLTNPEPALMSNNFFNQPPLLTGYNDTLISLGQWPSVSHSWSVAPATEPGKDFQLEVELRFDINRYHGMLSARAVNQNTIEILFSEDVHPRRARDPELYAIAGGIRVDRVEVKADGKTVVLHVDDLLLGYDYILETKRIPWAIGNESPNGEAQFHFPDIPGRRTTTLMKQAARERKVFETVWHQLNDPKQVDLFISTTLLEDEEMVLDALQRQKLVGEWLSAVYRYVEDRAKGQIRIGAPPVVHTLAFPLNHSAMRQAQIYPLELFFGIRRLSNAVMGDFAATESIRLVSTQIHPTTGNTARNIGTNSLVQFATNFEKLTLQEGLYQFKIATGIDRFELSTSRSGSKIWVVKLGLSKRANDGIFYRINNTAKPVIFAPRPISNELVSRENIPIKRFDQTKGLVEPAATNFVNIDMDVWGRQLLDAVDYVLHPRFTAAIQIIDQKSDTKSLQSLLDQKKELADIVQNWMIEIFEDESSPGAAQAREVFRQRLLSRLSNAYNIHAALQFEATVRANISGQAAFPPQLYGNVNFAAANNNGTARSNVTLSSPKLALHANAEETLTILLSAPGLVKGNDGEVLSALDLDLAFQGTAIEHQVGTLPGIEDYKASSWLTFVVPTAVEPLKADLGAFQAPLVLRSYPESPEMIRQLQKNEPVQTSELGRVKIWAYQFMYARSFHYPQDRLHCEVEFNIKEALKDRAGLLDAFEQIAQFVLAYPDIKATLDQHLSKVTVATGIDEADFLNAKIALETFNTLLSNITAAANSTAARSLALAARSRSLEGNELLTYRFVIQEGIARINDTDGILYVQIEEEEAGRPRGIGQPIVQIEGYDSIAFSPGAEREAQHIYYWFKHRETGQPLKAEAGQKIVDRIVVLPGMDIFQRQNAKSSVQLKRNEELIPGRPSAEPFVYATGDVEFANPYPPTIDVREVVEISEIGTAGNRTLSDHLKALWKALLENNTQPTLTVHITCTYTHKINAQLPPVKLPVFLQPPVTINVPTLENASTTALDMVIEQQWVEAIKKWYGKNQPKGEEDSIGFDLVVMSNLTQRPMPLLRLRNLRLLVNRTTDLKPEVSA